MKSKRVPSKLTSEHPPMILAQAEYSQTQAQVHVQALQQQLLPPRMRGYLQIPFDFIFSFNSKRI